MLDPLLVPLDPDNERAALIALAVLLAPVGAADAGPDDTGTSEGTATPTNDNQHDSADNGQEGEADL